MRHGVYRTTKKHHTCRRRWWQVSLAADPHRRRVGRVSTTGLRGVMPRQSWEARTVAVGKTHSQPCRMYLIMVYN